jgi:cytidylate kinase
MSAQHVAVITVDGPSGVGKGTISHLLAGHFGFHFLDSGALYRLTALAAHNHGVDFGDEEALAEIAAKLDVAFLPDDSGEVRVVLENQDVSTEIRTEIAGNNASKVAVLPAVREALLQRQRDFAKVPGLIADGRDMGTTVFPQATVKLFLTASAEVRAERRYKQLIEKGLDANLRGLIDEIRQRDERDRSRSVSPLRPAEDAITIDTSTMSIEQVFAEALRHCEGIAQSG